MKNWRDDLNKSIPMITEISKKLPIETYIAYLGGKNKGIWTDAIAVGDFIELLSDEDRLQEIRRILKLKAFW